MTNGQEELASLAYLITMHWASENVEVVRAIGDEYEERMRALAARFPATVAGITGQRHLLGIAFHELATARAFTAALNRAGFDISVQSYKADCPPVALTKLPVTACRGGGLCHRLHGGRDGGGGARREIPGATAGLMGERERGFHA